MAIAEDKRKYWCSRCCYKMPKELRETSAFADFVLDPFKDWKPTMDVEINSDDDDDEDSDHGELEKRSSVRFFGNSRTKNNDLDKKFLWAIPTFECLYIFLIFFFVFIFFFFISVY